MEVLIKNSVYSVDRKIKGLKTRGAYESSLNSLHIQHNPRSIAIAVRRQNAKKGFGVYENGELSSSCSHF